MKTLVFFAVVPGLLLILEPPAVRAQDDAAKPAPMKPVPTPGKLEIEVTAGDKTETYEHPSKALRDIGRAVSRTKRAKEGEEPVFEAVITLNDQVFNFSDPEAALEACKALAGALRDLPKLKMGLGDLGEIPEVKPEDQPQQGQPQTTKPKGPPSRAAAMAIVRQRINAALQRQMIGTGSSGAGLRIPNPTTMQQIVNQELEKARREGLLPTGANANAGNLGAFAGDPREAKKEAIVQTLAFVLGQADSTGKGEEAPKAEETPKAGETPKADETPKAEDGKKPEETKPAETPKD